MLLKSIHLQNIRSYTDAVVSFPNGKVLLAGDIGSGKTSILNAIEFALFGLGEMAGDYLLRAGKSSGSVALQVELDGQQVIVQRQLKRTKTSIIQDSATFQVGDGKRTLTPGELKSVVFGLLGYPRELLSKSKNSIFRYTVYTPQEEMKAILLASPDERISILRRIFGVDKYKRVRDNTSLYLQSARARRRELEGRTADLPVKQGQVVAKEAELAATVSSLDEHRPRLEQCKSTVGVLRLQETALESQFRDLQTARNDLSAVEAGIRYKQEYLQRQREDLALNKQQIEKLEQTASPVVRGVSEIQKSIISAESDERTALAKSKDLLIRIAEHNACINNEAIIQKKMGVLSSCPVCLQDVPPSHKSSVVQASNDRAQQHEKQRTDLQKQSTDAEAAVKAARDALSALRLEEQTARLAQFQQAALAEKKAHLQSTIERVATGDKELLDLQQKLIPLQAAVVAGAALEQERNRLRTALQLALQSEQAAAVVVARLEQAVASAGETLAILRSEVSEREKAVAQLQELRRLEQWLGELFVPLTETMEKHVMTAVWQEFHTVFQDCFTALVEDDLLIARLDDTFTPLIIQNGHDLSAECLSGGERTACALAYRLALNKVISSLIDTIRTRDLLILDEPTDGFSAAQVSKLRDVLDSAGCKQVIIVSHDAQVEGFVEHIIRVEKEGHVSRVLA